MSYQPKVRRLQGGNVLEVVAGGEIRMGTGGKVTADGTQASVAPNLTENAGAIGGTNDGDLPDLSTPSAALNAEAVREVATKVNTILAALRGAGIIPSS